MVLVTSAPVLCNWLQGHDLFYKEPTPLSIDPEEEAARDDHAMRALQGF
jgi:hypothetical protein